MPFSTNSLPFLLLQKVQVLFKDAHPQKSLLQFLLDTDLRKVCDPLIILSYPLNYPTHGMGQYCLSVTLGRPAPAGEGAKFGTTAGILVYTPVYYSSIV